MKVLVTWESPWQWIEAFRNLAYEIVQVPLISTQIVPNDALKEALKCKKGRILLFSKAALKGLLVSIDHDFKCLDGWVLAAVGPQTALEAREQGLNVDRVGPGTALGLIESLLSQCPLPWILPVGDRGQASIYAPIKLAHKEFATFEVYKNIEPDSAQNQLSQHLKDTDVILLSSPSAAERLFKNKSFKNSKIFSIGPTTTSRVHELGYTVHWQADEPSYSSFAEGLRQLT